jgi:rare lipoprotein A (peptidoglycan hydrolase)
MHCRRTSLLAFALLALGVGRSVAETSGPARHQAAWSRQTTVMFAPPTTAAIGRDPAWPASVVRVRTSPGTTGALADPPHPSARRSLSGHALDGIASYYWQGQKTASGEPFDKTALTAAHPTLPFNTRVKVTDAASGRSVVVRINDRGPFKAGRVIDLSERAAGVLDMKKKGLAHVKIEVLP